VEEDASRTLRKSRQRGGAVVQPWHRNNANLLTRWTWMLAAPARDWSVFQQIFADQWEVFQQAQPRYQTPYYHGLVGKMLACGNPAKMGYLEYRCLHCGQGHHVVSMSCQSSLCLRCAKVYVDNWVSQVSQVLHEGVIYRHIILTVPALFRTTFYQNAAMVFRVFMRCGAQCLDDFYSTVRGKTLRGGSITVLHTHGRNGPYHPHLHVLATSGGYDGASERWEHLQ
jgi:Transposase zinc-binding domain/Putative transposase